MFNWYGVPRFRLSPRNGKELLRCCTKYTGRVIEYCQRLLRWRMKNEDQRMEHWASKHRKR